jgi:hypothetical protein
MKLRAPATVTGVNAVDEQRVKMDIQRQCQIEALNRGDGTGLDDATDPLFAGSFPNPARPSLRPRW